MRHCWLRLCIVWPSHSHTSLSTASLASGKARIRREPNLGCRGGRQTLVMWCFTKKACTRAVEWKGPLSWWSWSARSVIVNATVTQYTSSVNGVSLPTRLAPRESDYSRMGSKVSSGWLPSYIKATRPVLEIFKMDGYFLDSHRIVSWRVFVGKYIDCRNVQGMSNTEILPTVWS